MDLGFQKVLNESKQTLFFTCYYRFEVDLSFPLGWNFPITFQVTRVTTTVNQKTTILLQLEQNIIIICLFQISTSTYKDHKYMYKSCKIELDQ